MQLRNASKFARVHVFATRYRAGVRRVRQSEQVRDAEPDLYPARPAESVYLTGPQHRRRVPLRPRPQVCEEVPRQHARTAVAAAQSVGRPLDRDRRAGRGGRRGLRRAVSGPPATPSGSCRAAGAKRLPRPSTSPTSISWPTPSAVLVNLVPDKDGVVEDRPRRVRRAQDIHVVAVDPLNTTFRTRHAAGAAAAVRRPAAAERPRPARRTSRSRSRSPSLPAGQEFTLDDIATAKFEAYDSLARVYGLYATLTKTRSWPSSRSCSTGRSSSPRRSGRCTRSTPATS